MSKQTLCVLSLLVAATGAMTVGANALEQANGLSVNGLAMNGLSVNGLAFNGLAFNGTSSDKASLEPATLIMKDGTKIILQ